MSTRLPQAPSRLRPPSRLPQQSSATPVTKRRASDDDLPHQSPSKRSCRLKLESCSDYTLDENDASNISTASSVMGPPMAISTLRKQPPIARNKMRRSVSMATIPVGAGVRRAAAAATRGRPMGGGLSRSNLKLSGSSINITGRPSSVTSRAPLTGPGVRRPGTNITSRINNARNSGGAAAASTNGSATLQRKNSASNVAAVATAPPLEKGRSKRPGWDLKGRMEDMERCMNSLKEGRHEDAKNVTEMQQQLTKLLQDKQALTSDLTQTETVKAAAQEELQKAKQKLRELEESSQSRISTQNETISRLEASVKEKDWKMKEIQLDLDLKMEEILHLKTSLSEKTRSMITMEAQLAAKTSEISSKEKENVELTQRVAQLCSEIGAMKQKVMEGEDQRRKLHNMVQELKGNIRVYCRVRPLLGEEVEGNGGSDTIHHINVLGENALELLKDGANCDSSSMSGLKGRNNNAVEFTYDRVFGPKDAQTDVFEEVSQLVQSALDGYNVCVFAYGQTGSGKTYTMEGRGDASYESAGIIPRTVAHIFGEVERLKDHGWDFKLEASILEIYNETIRDLLATPAEAKSLSYEIKAGGDSRCPHTYVTNLKLVPVSEQSEITGLLHTAHQHRAVAATNMNLHSSRSHSVFRLMLRGTNSKTSTTCEGSLSLVDLAGSERLKESGSTGARLTETQNINRSLSNLSNVIMALGQKQSHIPYRNSKLTHLLQPSLGGNSKTLMLVNVSPLDACANETLNSLRFATKVNTCHVGVASKQSKKN